MSGANHTSERWDALVVGAGPCGSVAARRLALGGARVLLVDRAKFPRAKVCGCCLNEAALGLLADEGLDGVVAGLGGSALGSLRLLAAGRELQLRTRAGLAVSRAVLDDALFRAARDAGVDARDGVGARVLVREEDGWRVRLQDESGTREIVAEAVLCADGLGGSSLPDDERWRVRVTESARMGLGVVAGGEGFDVALGQVHMAIARSGYVGIVRLDADSVDIAAAVDAAAVRDAGRPARAVQRILEEAGAKVPASIAELKFHGTPRLTRRRARVEHAGLFVAGDAAGYVEPFTGEGMSWAIASGILAAQSMGACLNGAYANGSYARELARRTRGRALACRVICESLRYPAAIGSCFGVMGKAAGIAPGATRGVTAAIAGQFGRPFAGRAIPGP